MIRRNAPTSEFEVHFLCSILVAEQFGDGDECRVIGTRSPNVTYSFGSEPNSLRSNDMTKCVYEFEVHPLCLNLVAKHFGDADECPGIGNRSANVTPSIESELNFLSSNETTKCVYEVEVQLLGLNLEALCTPSAHST